MADKPPQEKAREDLQKGMKEVDALLKDLKKKEEDLKNKGYPPDSQPLPEDFNEGPHLPGLG